MTKRRIFAAFVYFIGLVLPVLAMLNCSGFDEGSMKVESCFIDSEFIRSYASFYYGWALISAFMIFIPIAIYVGIVILIAKFLPRVFKIEKSISGDIDDSFV